MLADSRRIRKQIDTGVLAKPPITKQDYDSEKTERECTVYAIQYTLLCLPYFGKLVRN